MKSFFSLLFVSLAMMACNGQNSIATNEVIQTRNNFFGVQAEDGKLLIDSVYREIRVLFENSKMTLPASEHKKAPKPIEYYLATGMDQKQAIFDQNGKLVTDIIDSFGFQFDPHTGSVVKTKKLPDNRYRSSLYNLEGKLLFEDDFEHIYFIDNSDLIALIVEDGSNDEFYLYNPFTKEKHGPYDHFNIFTQSSRPLLGMKTEGFEKYKKLNVITVRKSVDNDYVWGVRDMKGNEILPMAYSYFRVIEDRMRSSFIEKATKPEGVDFLFYSRNIADTKTILFLDAQMNVYTYSRSEENGGKIQKVE